MSKQYQNLLAGRLYKLDDKIQSMKNKGRYLSRLFNQITEEENAERKNLIKQLFGSTGENYIKLEIAALDISRQSIFLTLR